MKIPPNDSSKKIGASEGSDAVVIKRKEALQRPALSDSEAQVGKSKGSEGAAKGADRIDIGVGRFLQENLDPAKIEEEGRARVEALKKLVQSGEYKIDSERVAAKVAEALTEEVDIARLSGEAQEPAE